MELSLTVDLLFYSTLIPLIILIYLIPNSDKSEPAVQLFKHVLIISFTMSFIDGLSWIPNGNIAPWARVMNVTTNHLYFALCTLPPLAWVRYFDYKIVGDREGVRKRTWFYIIPTLIGWTLIIINYFTGIIFHISDINVYVRGPFNAVFLYINYLLFFISLLAARKHWKYISGSLIQVLMLFILLPIIGSVIQQFFFGVTLTYPLSNLTTLLAFIYLEKNAMLKDTLTKLYTRSQFTARLRYKLRKKEPFTVLLADMNDFKQINDGYGHEEGDKALIMVSTVLQNNVKRGDIVCRYGGDEFTLLIESDDENIGKSIIQRIDRALEEFNLKGVKEYALKMSLGYRFVNSPIKEEELMIEVDHNMYQDKMRRKGLSG